jgi:hypothetical protein
MPKDSLAASHLEDLARHAGYELIERALNFELERRRKELERAKGDEVAKLQGRIDSLRFQLVLPRQLFEAAKGSK